ncbi:DnaJ domain-containing protein [Halogeometricum sp. S1BR25-6]|uniref:DnaJ domain-containing protein n=1 Tax=Halogeometricum salsisoli TaxID=2950536 RepID=A0ABU2GDI3_9EURY|nr:DnaJ domain-containing protein [Halogeometricum sp. S1BR25-6]MDS0298333.1 DnaJ domain-containing protein [Halogeometricum sp. S1BR25-6]
MENFYDLLGVSEDAAPADVKRAWRGKAREYHPDVNDDARAGVQFKTLRAAYEVLSDETKRAAYDRMGHERYVAERLDGLPTAGMDRREDGAGANGDGRWRKRADAAGGQSAGRSASTASASSAGRTRSSGANAGTGTAGRTRGTGRSRTESTRRSRSAGATDASRTDSARSANRSARTGSASTAGSGGESAGSAAHSASATAAPRSLWYAWTASLLAGVVYLGGLAVYLRANVAALSSFAASLEASPAATLLGDVGLVAPGAFALGAVGSAPGPALAFPAGAALLAAVFVAFAARFRHGTAGLSLYLYPVGALAPLASFALGPVVAAPAAGLTVALVVAVPVLTVTVFLADVGRTLFGSE